MESSIYNFKDFKIIPIKMLETVKIFPDKTAYRYYKNGLLKSISYKELLSKVEDTAKYLYGIGLRKGDHIGIYSENRIEWVIMSLSIQFLGGVTVGLYATASEADFLHMVSDSEIKFLAYGERTASYVDRHKEILKGLTLKNISFVNDKNINKKVDECVFNFDERSIDDIAQIVYTSGSSGSPKGALITHRAINYGINHLYRFGNAFDNDRRGKETFFNFMPMAHIASSMVDVYLNIFYGYEVTINSDILNIQKELKNCRPTLFMAPPALWERFHKKILEGLNKQTGIKKTALNSIIKYKDFAFSLNVKIDELPFDSDHSINFSLINGLTSGFKSFNNKAFNKLFKIVLAEIGLDRVNMCFTTGAKISDETLKFFSILGIDLVNVYGMSETTATAFYNSNYRSFNKVYFCGKEIEHGQIKITDEGELCIKGPFLFDGYYKKEQATKESFTEDGFLKTGDLAKKYKNGYFKIEGRLKDTIVLKSGENISPYAIEDLAKTIPFLSFCLANGNERKDVELLIFITNDDLAGLNNALNLGYKNVSSKRDEILSLEVVQLYYLKNVLNNNKHLSSLEKVGSIKILKVVPSIEHEILTPSLKMKRSQVLKKYNNGNLK